MKKSLYIFGAACSAATAVATSYMFAEKKARFLLWLALLAVALLLVFIALIVIECRSVARNAVNKVYRKKATYISRAEWEFLQVLRNIAGSRYEVCVQVPLVAVIDKSGAAFRNELFRVVDYLIADAVSYEPLLLIELNDASHKRADRAERDRKVAEICRDAQMPLISFTTAEAHNLPEVRKTILKMLKR